MIDYSYVSLPIGSINVYSHKMVCCVVVILYLSDIILFCNTVSYTLVNNLINIG
jgi:hypothetical protein